MNKILLSARIILAALAVLFTISSGLARADEPVVMKVATVAPDNTPWSELLKKYKSSVEKRSNGRIKVKIFLGGTLGDENETVLKCKRGQVEAVGASTGAIASQVPELNVVEIPYLFHSFEEADYVLDTVLLEPIQKLLPEYGFVFGYWSENGFRGLGTKDRFVLSPEDLRGKKMRSQESPIHLAMWRALGASPVPIPTTEVLTALKTGTVDGFDQAPLYAIAASWYTSIKFFTLSNHIYQPAAIIFNKEWYEKLDPDLQKVLIDAGRELTVKGRTAIRRMNPDLIKVLEAEGVKVQELTDAQKKVMEQATLPLRAEFRSSQGKRAAELLDLIEAGLAKRRGGK
jgi:tripartite ATP-independent transporter DctP family solute receptor